MFKQSIFIWHAWYLWPGLTNCTVMWPTFDIVQGQICCHARDHYSQTLLFASYKIVMIEGLKLNCLYHGHAKLTLIYFLVCTFTKMYFFYSIEGFLSIFIQFVCLFSLAYLGSSFKFEAICYIHRNDFQWFYTMYFLLSILCIYSKIKMKSR